MEGFFPRNIFLLFLDGGVACFVNTLAGGKVSPVPGISPGRGSMVGACIGSHVTVTRGDDCSENSRWPQ